MAPGIEVERTLLGLVTSVHVACGGHAGDEESMTATVAAALEQGVRVGAHPSYPDRAGFGRDPMEIDRGELGESLTEQLRALERICRAAGTTVASVKAHGALYEEVAKGGAIYETLRDAVRDGARRERSLGAPLGLPRHGDGAARRRDGAARRASATGPTVPTAGWSPGASRAPCWPIPRRRRRRRSAWPAARWWPATARC